MLASEIVRSSFVPIWRSSHPTVPRRRQTQRSSAIAACADVPASPPVHVQLDLGSEKDQSSPVWHAAAPAGRSRRDSLRRRTLLGSRRFGNGILADRLRSFGRGRGRGEDRFWDCDVVLDRHIENFPGQASHGQASEKADKGYSSGDVDQRRKLSQHILIVANLVFELSELARMARLKTFENRRQFPGLRGNRRVESALRFAMQLFDGLL